MLAAILAVLICAFCASALVTGFMRRFALRRNLLDLPNLRSSHANPTPRGGGVAIALAFLAALLELFILNLAPLRTTLALLGGGGAIALVGFLDDRRPLSAHLRFAVHIAAAIFVVSLLGALPRQFASNWRIYNATIDFAMTVVILAWGTNLFNFMDGIDGIAGSEAVFVSVAGAALNAVNGGDIGLTVSMLALASACLGFLAWNWPPARIFMGDVGSGFLGFTLTALALVASLHGNVPPEVWPILGGVFLVDATVTLLRRIFRGDRWLEPHRTHAYQNLARKFGGHRPVTLGVIGINTCWLLPWACWANARPTLAWAAAAAALAPLVLLAWAAGAGKREC